MMHNTIINQGRWRPSQQIAIADMSGVEWKDTCRASTYIWNI